MGTGFLGAGGAWCVGAVGIQDAQPVLRVCLAGQAPCAPLCARWVVEWTEVHRRKGGEQNQARVEALFKGGL